MKKMLLLAALVLATGSAMAQQNTSDKKERSFGVQVLLDDQLGLGVKYRHGLSKFFRVEGSLNAYLPEHKVSAYSLNGNLHYLIDLGNKWQLYPLAGLTYLLHTGNGTTSGAWGYNLGCGADYALNKNLALTLEGKFQGVNGYNHFVPAVGLAVKF